MPVGDIPTISSYAYSSAALPLSHAVVSGSSFGGDFLQQMNAGELAQAQQLGGQARFKTLDNVARVQPAKQEEVKSMSTRRLVKVIIVDPHPHVPVEDCVIYSGTEKLTDATNQELFFELNINGLMARHNEKRTKLLDKSVKERIEYLEPAKIRDLKMVVVDIASF